MQPACCADCLLLAHRQRLEALIEACSGAEDTGSPRGIRGVGYEAHVVTAVSGTELHRATAGSGARREVMLCDDNHSTSGTMVCSLRV